MILVYTFIEIAEKIRINFWRIRSLMNSLLIEEKPTKLGDIIQLGQHRLMCGDNVEMLLDGEKPNLMLTFLPNNTDLVETICAYSAPILYIWCQSNDRLAEHMETIRKLSYDIEDIIVCPKQAEPSKGKYYNQYAICIFALNQSSKDSWIGSNKQTNLWRSQEIGRPIQNHAGFIYNPFAGLGDILFAAEKQNRMCFAMEKDPELCNIIVKRWNKMKAQLMLF